MALEFFKNLITEWKTGFNDPAFQVELLAEKTRTVDALKKMGDNTVDLCWESLLKAPMKIIWKKFQALAGQGKYTFGDILKDAVKEGFVAGGRLVKTGASVVVSGARLLKLGARYLTAK